MIVGQQIYKFYKKPTHLLLLISNLSMCLKSKMCGHGQSYR